MHTYASNWQFPSIVNSVYVILTLRKKIYAYIMYLKDTSGQVVAHLPWRVNLVSLMCDMDRWPSRVSGLHSVVAGLISCGGDHSIYCWWDPIRSKQLFSVLYVTCRWLLNFLVMVIQLTYMHIYIYYHHEVVLIAQVPLTLSCYLSLSSVALRVSSSWHPVSTLN